jgi:hypothetical protein
VFLRSHRSLYLFHTKEKFLYDAVGHLHGNKGTADFYFREDMGNIGPFAANPWWSKSGHFDFPGPGAEPQDAEYEYWSNMHKDAFAAGFQAPWKDFLYSKGAKSPNVDEMLKIVYESTDDKGRVRPDSTAKTFCYRGDTTLKAESKPGKDEDWT